tara:strand:- start:4634 stop:5002 length:369 start_codon:yes stop_codon:yes gene_type:complete
MSDIWIPEGAAYNGAAPLGLTVDTAQPIVHHTFTFTGKDRWGVTHTERIIVVQRPDEGDGELEQKIGEARDSFKAKLRDGYEKRPPTLAEKKEIGQILNQILGYRNRRRESTNNLIYYPKNY